MELQKVKKESLSEVTKEALHNLIKSMDAQSETKLPREEILAEKLGVSRVTLRKAIHDLSKEGLIFSLHGKGTFINSEALRAHSTLDPDMDFFSMITENGYKVGARLIGFDVSGASSEEQVMLKLTDQNTVIRSIKAFYANDMPAILCTDCFSDTIIGRERVVEQGNDQNYNPFKLISSLTDHKLVWYKIEMSTIESSEIRIQEFVESSESKTFLCCQSIYYDQNNLPIVFSTVFIDTKIIKVHFIRKK